MNTLFVGLSVPERSEGTEVMKMAIRAATVYGRRKDFGGARILAARNERRGPCHAVVCPSVCLLLCELVPAALADLNEIFGGGQGWCQARLSPESAQSVKVRVRKGREI